jgi:hypothetical protein
MYASLAASGGGGGGLLSKPASAHHIFTVLFGISASCSVFAVSAERRR